MKKAIYGTKIGMTQVFAENGDMIPVTVVKADPATVIQVKTVAKDKYAAVKVGFGEVREKLVSKPVKGQFAKAEIPAKRFIKELRIDDAETKQVGDVITVEVFANGDRIDVSGINKGKGYAGAIKRWNQHRGPMAHGSHYHRAPGSLSACSSPSRVFKTKRLPGHMGAKRVTIQNLEIVRVIPEKNLLLIKGSVPGPKGNLLAIKNTVKG